jgi:hypothetical protein
MIRFPSEELDAEDMFISMVLRIYMDGCEAEIYLLKAIRNFRKQIASCKDPSLLATLQVGLERLKESLPAIRQQKRFWWRIATRSN